jgi:hypothetical protein
MGFLRLVDFVEMFSQDRGGFLKTSEQDLIELRLAESALERLLVASPFRDLETEGETEQSLGVE